ncbi:MAG TPA: Na+/H+ antiporter subunit E [Chloroflexota bacterium]|nr:Na+/H+ antiporter subunit E [Chloroflexota bacterium]HUM70188.1 Na+/H+ antiporter subunit E [Chloroflexota bacterium]
MVRVRVILTLTLVYLALTASLAPLNILAGVLVGTAVTFLLPNQHYRQMSWRSWPAANLAFLRYIVMLVIDLVVSGIQVARIVLSPQMSIRPGIIAILSQTTSDLATAFSAHAITLTPGELVVEIDADGVMYTHCLDVDQAAITLAAAQQERRELLEKMFS